MQPTLLPTLVNGTTGDPALHIRRRHGGPGLLVDLGELAGLSSRQLLAVGYVFVSHAHMDHFAGFDRLLRVALGRDRTIQMFGPQGFVDRVGHKLGGYTWNLVGSYTNDFTLVVTEVPEAGLGRRARFRVGTGFEREPLEPTEPSDGLLMAEPGLEVRTTVLDHGTPCLAFALQEPEHLAVWPNRLAEMGLVPGDWLQALKSAIRADAPEDRAIPVAWADPDGQPPTLPLARLRDGLISRSRGQKLAYVVDARFSDANAERIAELAADADRLYIEAAFLERDAERAAATRHLTARQAGELARRAGVNALVPFHFSSRYEGNFQALEQEALAAFRPS